MVLNGKEVVMEIRPIRVVQYGLGATGKDIAALVAQTPGLVLVGGIDTNPDLIGQDLGDVIGIGARLNTIISSDPVAVLSATLPDIVVVATTSHLNDAYPQLATCLRARVNVLSTCEELVYPYVRHPQLAQNLDDLARRGGVSLLGVGINPGFIMDLLPLILTSPCTTVRSIAATRVINAKLRRATLYQRIGAGLTREEFRRQFADKHVPHVGLRESLHLIADRIGWQLDRIDEWVDPLISTNWVYDERVRIPPDQVYGIRQSAVGFVGGQDVVVLNWQAVVGSPETYDSITIDGVPSINLRIEGGLHGGQAAPALVVHAIAPTVACTPGLHTVADLPPTHYRLPASGKA